MLMFFTLLKVQCDQIRGLNSVKCINAMMLIGSDEPSFWTDWYKHLKFFFDFFKILKAWLLLQTPILY